MGIRIGMVGLGNFAKQFVRLFAAHPAVDGIALCDREADRVKAFASDPFLQTTFNPKDAYTSLEDMLSSDVDAIALFTQPWLHAPQVIAAMHAGKHVYSAVPVVSLPDDDEILEWCDTLVSTALSTGMHYMLGETTYFHPDTMYARRLAAQGAFGDFVYGEGEYMHDVDAHCSLRSVYQHRSVSQAGAEWEAKRADYKARGALSGPMHYPTHSVCGPVSVMNTFATKVTAYGYCNQRKDPFFQDDAFSNEIALFKMDNGATVRIAEMREAPGSLGKHNETFRIVGTEGTFVEGTWSTVARTKDFSEVKPETVVLTPDEMRDTLPDEVLNAFKSTLPADKPEQQELNYIPSGHHDSHPWLVHEFVDAAASDRLPAINAWQAVRYMAMGAMAHKSARADGETLNVPDWGNAPSEVTSS